MRFLVREADFQDRVGLLALAQHFPLCSLPREKTLLERQISISKESFAKTIPARERNYLFVLEDRQKKAIIGSSQILSYFGLCRPLCWFHTGAKQNPCLILKRARTGRHQLGGLILRPEYRHSKESLGLQIAFARFLYIKTYPKQFSPKIEVSLTASVHKTKNSFWKETGQKQAKISYSSAFKHFQKNRSSFPSLFPEQLKINLTALSNTAQAYLKQVHPQTLPVYKGLLKRGFYKTNRHHILDGGIYLEAVWKNLPFLKKTKLRFIKKAVAVPKTKSILMAQQTKHGFICCRIKGAEHGQRLFVSKRLSLIKEGKALCLNFPF